MRIGSENRRSTSNGIKGTLLARAYALTGDTAKSRQAYEDFLDLWKDADPSIPILQEAKTEYVKVK